MSETRRFAVGRAYGSSTCASKMAKKRPPEISPSEGLPNLCEGEARLMQPILRLATVITPPTRPSGHI